MTKIYSLNYQFSHLPVGMKCKATHSSDIITFTIPGIDKQTFSVKIEKCIRGIDEPCQVKIDENHQIQLM